MIECEGSRDRVRNGRVEAQLEMLRSSALLVTDDRQQLTHAELDLLAISAASSKNRTPLTSD